MAARCGSTRAHADDAAADRAARVDARCATASARRLRPLGGLRSASPRVAGDQARACSRSCIEARATGKTVAGYGAPGQGQHAAQLLRHPDRPPGLHRRPQPVQAGQVPAGHAHPDPRARALAETRPDYVLILPWNLADEIVGAARRTPRAGAGDFVVPIPRRGGRAREGRAVLRRAGACACARQSEAIPKPMVPIGYRPILWHVMRYYAHFGHRDFILCLGYRADAIKDYFLDYDEALSNDFVLVRRRARGRAPRARTSTTGGSRSSTPGSTPRSASGCARSGTHLEGEEIFLANYGDMLTDAPLDRLVERVAGERTRWQLPGGPADSYPFHVVDARRRRPGARASRRHARPTCGSTAATSCCAARSSTTCSPARSWWRSRSQRLIAAGGSRVTATRGSGRRWTRCKRHASASRAWHASGKAPWELVRRRPRGADAG